uniref:Chitin-binding type-2 domain-containing protein n=1 Tax=Ascaris lumbricoides TaxID=6252 RepID=A0A0M3ICJ9_ASCLU
MKKISSFFVVAFIIAAVSSVGQNSAENDIANEQVLGQPKYWRAILGDVCQLPSFPYATGDPTRYVECVRQNNTINDRADVGIWQLRDCPPEHIFVAPADRCLTPESIISWMRFCEEQGGNNHSLCLYNNDQDTHFVVQEAQLPPQHCKCSNDDKNCTCPTAEIFEPVLVNNSARSGAHRNAKEFEATNLRPCTICPSLSADCFCPVNEWFQCHIGLENIKTEAWNHYYCSFLVIKRNEAGFTSAATSDPSKATAANFTTTSIVYSTGSAGYNIETKQVSPQRPQVTRQRRQQQTSRQQVSSTQQAQQKLMRVNSKKAEFKACRTTTTQQSYCPQQNEQQSIVQPQACPLVQGQVSQTAEYQGICSWMVDPLAVDPQGVTTYLQCQPTTNDVYCGRWQRMPCSPGTTFDVAVQLCVWHPGVQAGQVSLQTPSTVSLPAGIAGQCACTSGVPISSCGENNQCPGQSTCQIDTQVRYCL